MQHLYRKIYADPKFIELRRKKALFSWSLAILVMSIYFSFILVVAFKPELFATPISPDSVISWGIPIGVFVIVCSFVLTGIYVFKANKEFDKINQELLDHYKNNENE